MEALRAIRPVGNSILFTLDPEKNDRNVPTEKLSGVTNSFNDDRRLKVGSKFKYFDDNTTGSSAGRFI